MNRSPIGGVLLGDVANDRKASLADDAVDVEDDLARDFEAGLAESSTLAFRVAYSVLRQREDAEDVAQEAIAKAYRHLHRLRDRTTFRAWLVRMVWRSALDRRRGDLRRTAREREHGMDLGARDGHFDRIADVWDGIEGLPERLRIVLILASIEGHDIGEVAALLRIPQGTVKSRLFEARKQLREKLSWTQWTRPAR